MHSQINCHYLNIICSLPHLALLIESKKLPVADVLNSYFFNPNKVSDKASSKSFSLESEFAQSRMADPDPFEEQETQAPE